MKKAVEGKVRLQTQELPNQKHAAKAFIHPNVFYDSGLQTGSLCTIEATTANGTSKRCQVIGWPSPDKNIAKNVVLLSRALQKAANLELGDAIRVSDAGDVPEAETIVVKDVTPDNPSVVPDIQKFWLWNIKGRLGRSRPTPTWCPSYPARLADGED